MKIQQQVMIGFSLVTFVLFSAYALAAEQKLTMEAGPDGKGSQGQVVIRDSATDQKEIAIHASGLKPNSVYTVWLVNMKPKMEMIGIGEGDYSFKSDDKGEGHYVAALEAEALRKWQMLEIAYHPDGNAKNMEKIGIALKSDLK